MAPWTIAKNTYRELIRDRILYGLLIFAILLIGFSLALGQLSYSEQARISVNFGLVGIHLSALVLSIFVGSTLVSREMEKQTVLTLLARPITRIQFLWGKFLGLSLVILTVMLGLSAILSIVMLLLNFPINTTFFICLLGIVAESWIMLGFTMLFGMISRPLLTVCCSVGLFLIGHWLKDLDYFSVRSNSEAFKALSWAISFVLPNLERLNWKSSVTYGDLIPLNVLGSAMGYAICWILILVSVAGLLFRRKDFV